MSRVLLNVGVALTALAVCVLSLASQAEASTVLRFGPEDMTDRAAVILHAKVIYKQSRHLDRGVIVTDYRLEIREALKGFKGKLFSFTAYGGVVGERGSGISGASSFTKNEEILVFLTRINKLGVRACVGLAQGKYTVRVIKGKSLAFRDLEGLRYMDRKSGKLEDAKPEQGVDFLGLIQQIKKRLAASKKAKQQRKGN
jgi:hypothetical protein